MSERLPVFVDPIRLAEARRALAGKLPLKVMDRLTPYLVNVEGEVAVELEFGVDEQKIRYIRGRLQADLEMCCQRCMQTLHVPIDRTVNLGLVGSEAEAERLPEYDPLIVESKEIRLSEVIEDELLLALPMIAMHPEGTCRPEYEAAAEEEEEGAGERRKSPFDVLADLKKHK